MTEELKIALVDDQSLCRRGLSELLARCYGFNVLGAVGTIEDHGPHMAINTDNVILEGIFGFARDTTMPAAAIWDSSRALNPYSSLSLLKSKPSSFFR